jgi:hypothetical protein
MSKRTDVEYEDDSADSRIHLASGKDTPAEPIEKLMDEMAIVNALA